jgi:hypothetical protein
VWWEMDALSFFPFDKLLRMIFLKKFEIFNKNIWDNIKMQQMKKTELNNEEIRERIKKGLDVTFKKLLKTSKQWCFSFFCEWCYQKNKSY